MATTGCASAGSSTVSRMNEVHSLRWSPSLPLSHSRKLVFLLHLPTTRPNLVSSSRHRRPLSSALLCGHGELEIISVKELADGFLHFSFGTPNSKVDDISSSCGEHLAGKTSLPKLLPSKFSKKLPMPVASARRKRQEKSSSKEGPATPSNVKETMKPSLRPKSYFVKRSPIPSDKTEILFVRGNVSHGTAVLDKNSVPRGPKVVSIKDSKYARPISRYVRNSPIPHSAVKLNKRHATLSASSDFSPTEVCKDAPAVPVTSKAGSSLRPKSSFSRRSPIVKDQPFSQGDNRTSNASSPALLNGRETTSLEVSAKSQDMAKESTHLVVDLEKCKLSELKSLAKLKRVKGYSKLKKAELLNVLKNLDV